MLYRLHIWPWSSLSVATTPPARLWQLAFCASLWCMLMYPKLRLSQRQMSVLDFGQCLVCYLSSQIWTSGAWVLLLSSDNLFSDGKTTLKVTMKDPETHWWWLYIFRPLLTIWVPWATAWLWPVVGVDIQLFLRGNEFYHSPHVLFKC